MLELYHWRVTIQLPIQALREAQISFHNV